MERNRSAPSQSLVSLAARGSLPRHQYPDAASIQWITAHRPPLPPGRATALPPAHQRLLRRCTPRDSWFAEGRCVDSLHGVRHALRTAALAAVLADRAGLTPRRTATLVLAAAVHDCRRLHDGHDRGHGRRAAHWLTSNAAQLHDRLGTDHRQLRANRQLGSEQPQETPDFAEAATAVRLHDVPYQDFSPADTRDHLRAGPVVDLLKAADALDRYRLPRLDWWPDPARVRTTLPAWLHGVAFDLVVGSETAWLSGVSSTDAVRQSLARLGAIP
ncbi:HD domain-containing protein [Streptomyces otsuchiensis]|uniref:HD domain-containing protein n=1 Tax=Streptomyces otsuchiensis TaxID=2681388 RepID=UPI00102F4191|nr:HD domain-containing protein [Streptomyces otsuchiensis]